MRTELLIALAGLALASCLDRQDPPGANVTSSGPRVVRAAPAGSASMRGPSEASSSEVPEGVLGTLEDNLPFKPNGTKLASIAWRTWVYTDTGPKRTRLGYLRAGAVVDARGPTIKNAGCAGGWYRINPRGFVCIGKGATTDLKDYAVTANSVRPERGKGLPYLYAMASDVPPYLYFKLPTAAQMRELEGGGISRHVEAWKVLGRNRGLAYLWEDPEAPPSFLSPHDKLIKPYGVKERLHYSVHSGRSSPDAGFAIARVFEWEGRMFGLTTELDVIALDRTTIVKPSEFHGVELEEGEDLPVAFMRGYSPKFELVNREFKPVDHYASRAGVKLTGEEYGGGMKFLKTRDGSWITPTTARIIQKRDSFPSVATGTRKWIDISIKHQTLVAYVGTKAVYATLISSGRGGLGDPEKVPATARGTFMIHSKHVSATMDGDEDKSDSFNLLDVPFVQYFHKGYALHGTYWHDEFGELRSHGCVNLSPIDAAWLFEWTDPVVPPGWHSRLNKDRGTVVYIHF